MDNKISAKQRKLAATAGLHHIIYANPSSQQHNLLQARWQNIELCLMSNNNLFRNGDGARTFHLVKIFLHFQCLPHSVNGKEEMPVRRLILSLCLSLILLPRNEAETKK